MVRILILSLALAGCASVSPALVTESRSSASIHFTATALPAGFVPVAIMKDGTVPGSVGNSAAIYRAGVLKKLGSFNGEPTVATAINDSGVAVGYATESPPTIHALEFVGGTMFEIGHPKVGRVDYTIAQPSAINDAKDIYGMVRSPDLSNAPQCAKWRPPVLVENNTTDGRGSIYNVNSSGQFSFTDWIYYDTAFVAYRGSSPTTYQKIFPNAAWSSATWINDSGTVTGAVNFHATQYPFLPKYAYIAAAHPQVLPMLNNADDMEPAGINSSGDVVGNAYSANGNSRVFMFHGGQMSGISGDISPAGTYILLPGYSDNGSFVAESGSTYYVIAPSSI